MADLLPAYLIVGADELKRDAAVRRLRSHVPADMADFNLDELDGASLEEPGQLISSAQTMPFCADFRLVIVNGAGELAKPVSEAVVSYLADPNPQCVLCLVAEKLAKNTRLYKAIAKVGPHSVIDCAPLKRWELPPYVVKLAQKRGLSMDNAAAQELVERVGESTVALDNQIATLAQLVGDAGRITLADVEANVAQIAEVSPWAFADAVCERNAPRAMEMLNLMKARRAARAGRRVRARAQGQPGLGGRLCALRACHGIAQCRSLGVLDKACTNIAASVVPCKASSVCGRRIKLR